MGTKRMRKESKRIMIGFVVALAALVGIAAVPLTAQAAVKKKTVYVITKVVDKNKYSKVTHTYAYGNNGLITGTTTQKGPNITPEIYTYDAKNRFKTHTFKGMDGNIYTDIFSHDKYGRVVKTKHPLLKTGIIKSKYNKEGYCISDGYTKRKYDSDGNLIQKKGYETWKYKYDSKGNWIYASSKHSVFLMEYTIKNTYNNGLLTKQIVRMKNSNLSPTKRTYTYKKISVPKKLAERIEGQQKYIRMNSYCVPDSDAATVPLETIYK